jgi:Arc/MetJ-type ribon-helix-helix transcriptional regulator
VVKKYTTIQLPDDMIELIDELLEKSIGYKSRAELVKAAVRDFAKDKGLNEKDQIRGALKDENFVVEVPLPPNSELVHTKEGEWDVFKVKRKS